MNIISAETNLNYAFELYPTLLSTTFAERFRIDPVKEQERLNNLGPFLDMLIADVCADIADQVKEAYMIERELIVSRIMSR